MSELLMAAATASVERGWIPDRAVRWGIRRLCRQRLDEEGTTRRGMDSRAALERFIAQLREEEIAPVPQKANEQHYELPPEFFRLLLGPRLKYSGCYWDQGATTLGEAEDQSLGLTAAHAGIEDGMRVLELGCGWGSLSLWMAQRYPRCTITAVSNSANQRRFIEGRTAALGLTNVQVITADMNGYAATGRFDRIVSVEMFEHMRNYHALLSRIGGWLEPHGRLFIHVFCHREYAYRFEAEGAHNWMGRHFFTGGLMPSVHLLPAVPAPFTLEQQWLWGGRHYQRTADAWLENLDLHRSAALDILASAYGRAEAPRWLARWRVFLMACAELFGYENGSEWGVAHYRFALREDRP